MKKKFFIPLCLLACSLIGGLTFASCDDKNNCSHTFTGEWFIRILKKGIKGDNGFVRSVQFTTGHESTGEYSDTFALPKGDYYLEIAKYESATIVGLDTVALYYSYES